MTLTDFKIAEIEIIYNPIIKPSQRPKICSSKDAFELLKAQWDINKLHYIEEFKVMLLNRSNKVLGISKISQGGISGTVVDPKVVMGLALKAAASGIILAHNHPSGNLSPSEADKKITQKLYDAGQLLEIPVLDHIILAGEDYTSFSDSCLLNRSPY